MFIIKFLFYVNAQLLLRIRIHNFEITVNIETREIIAMYAQTIVTSLIAEQYAMSEF